MAFLKKILNLLWRILCFNSALAATFVIFSLGVSEEGDPTSLVLYPLFLYFPYLYNKYAKSPRALMTLVVINSALAVITALGVSGLAGIGIAIFALIHLNRYLILKGKRGLFTLTRDTITKQGDAAQPAQKLSHTLRQSLKDFDAQMHEEDVAPIRLEKKRCPNCGCEYEGYYCPYCRQDNREGIDWYVQLLKMLSDAINFEGNTIRTLYLMLRCPGEMLHNYVDGKRQRYSDPVKFVAFSALAFVVMSVFFPTEVSNAYTFRQGRIDDIFKEFTSNIVIFQCLLLFVIELTPLYWAFRSTEEGRKLEKKDFYTILLYMIGMDFWLRALMTPLTSVNLAWNLLRIFLMFVYQFIVIRQFFRLSLPDMIWRYIRKYVYYTLFLILTISPVFLIDICRFKGTQMPMTNYLQAIIMGEFYTTPDVPHISEKLDKHAKEGNDPIGANAYTIDKGKVIISIEDSTLHVENMKTADIQPTLSQHFISTLIAHENDADLLDIDNLLSLIYEQQLPLVIRYTNPKTHISADAIISTQTLQDYLTREI